MNGLHDDFRQLVVRVHRRGKRFLRGLVPERQLTVIVKLIQNHANSVGICRQIQGRHGIKQLRRGIGALVFLRQRRITQRVQRDKAKIADAVLFFVRNKDVGGFQRYIQGPGLSALCQSAAQIQPQVHGFQLGHGTAAQVFIERPLVAAHQIDLITKAFASDGRHLPALVGQKAFLL